MNQAMNVRIQAPSPSSAFSPHRLSPKPSSSSMILPRATSSSTISYGFTLQIEASADINSSKTCLVPKDTFGWCKTQSLVLKQPRKKHSSFGALMTSQPQDMSSSSLIGEEKVGVLLLNLGGPETLDDVQPFLFNLFADPDIIRLPRPFRFLQKPLAQFISVARAPKSKEGYASIGGGSPLRKITDSQAEELRKALCAKNVPAEVYVGMRYWHPFTEEAIEQIKKDGIAKLVVLPLYPQFSISTSGSSLRLLENIFREDEYLVNMQHTVIPSWYQREGYIKAMANLIEKELEKFGQPEKVMIFFSAHGVPLAYVEEAGDPYKAEMEECVDLIMEELERRKINNPYTLAYQSRVGPVEWLKPYTDETIVELGQKGVKSLLAVPISFVSEHIETLEEIDVEYKELALKSGIEKWGRVPALGCEPSFISDLADAVIESLSYVGAMAVSNLEARQVRSFGGEKRQMSMFGSQVLAYQSSGIKLGIFKSVNESVTRVAVYISLMALYCLGGSKVKAGELSVGTVASFIGYTFTITFAVQGLVNTFGDLRGALAATERINSVLSGTEIDLALAYGLEREIKQKDAGDKNFWLYFGNGSDDKRAVQNQRYMSSLKGASSVRRLAQSGDICLEDVHFSYPLRPDVKILDGLDLTLKCGTVTALVGSSGAGKSTIVQLLARFYEPTRGRITVAGEDLRSFDKSEWARVVSIVNQEPVLFSVSVGENIAYGLPDDYVSKDDVVKAAKAANAHDFIISLPEGYDTLVGERGGLLSGGQRQRIAIARALLKNAPILILDEATSALDTMSERLVQSALNQLMKGRTTLVIAHRLSTVQNADQIALCSEGKIAELGTHSELLAKKGRYASLVGTQRLAFE